MRSACLSVSVGVALTGAGLVVTPIAAPPPVINLAAHPIDPYVDLVRTTVANLGAIGDRWLDDPLPALSQLIVNWANYGALTVTSFAEALRSFVDGLINLPGQLQTLLEAITAGDFEEVAALVIIIVLSVNPIPGLVDQLLQIPYAVAGNAVSAALAALHAAQVPIGVAAIGAAQATVDELELTVRTVLTDLGDGDIGAALTQVVEAPALILDAALNSDNPGLPGLLTVVEPIDETGLVDAVVNFLPRALADAINPDELLLAVTP